MPDYQLAVALPILVRGARADPTDAPLASMVEEMWILARRRGLSDLLEELEREASAPLEPSESPADPETRAPDSAP